MEEGGPENRIGMFSRCHARFRVWPLLSPSTGSGVGSGAQGRASLILVCGAVSRAPPVFFPQPARRPIPCSVLPCGATPTGNTAPVSRTGLGGSSPSGAPLRHQPGTGASLRYPVRTEFPWKRTEKNKRGSEGGDKDFSVLNDFKGLAEKSGKFVHGGPGVLYDGLTNGSRVSVASLGRPG